MIPPTHEWIVRRVVWALPNDIKTEIVPRMELILKYAIEPDRLAKLYDPEFSFKHHRPDPEGLAKLKKHLITARRSMLEGNVDEACKQFGFASHYLIDSCTWTHYADVFHKGDNQRDDDAHSKYETYLDRLNKEKGEKIINMLKASREKEWFNSEGGVDCVLDILTDQRNSALNHVTRPNEENDLKQAYRWTYASAYSIFVDNNLPERYWEDAIRLYKEKYMLKGFIDTIWSFFSLKWWKSNGIKRALQNETPVFVVMNHNVPADIVLYMLYSEKCGWYTIPVELKKRLAAVVHYSYRW